MSHETLQVIWFFGFYALIAGWVILDGFDLGVGIMNVVATRDDKERRLILNSIGPVWDGNEVWLVTAGGALFAAFPLVYASLLSAFYIPTMALLCSLIFRAVAIEFRSKMPQSRWRTFWDYAFAIASLAITFGLGVANGALLYGISLDAEGEYLGNWLECLHPFNLMFGVVFVALFMMHGTLYLVMKTEGELRAKLKAWVQPIMIFFIMAYILATMATLVHMPHISEAVRDRPYLSAIVIINVLLIANIPRELSMGRFGRAFISSSGAILFMVLAYAGSSFPNLIRCPDNLLNSITCYNGSSSLKTLEIMLLFAGIGLPLVISYTIMIYWIFRGKTQLESHSY